MFPQCKNTISVSKMNSMHSGQWTPEANLQGGASAKISAVHGKFILLL